MASYFSKQLFAFMRELAQNNNRDWFHANKERYETHVKEPTIAFLAELESRLEKGYEVSAKSILRQHRDTRFSKDKSPYKTSIACFMYAQNTRKSDRPHGYYLCLGNEESFFGAGVHAPLPANLLKIRNRIAKQPAKWAPVAKLDLSGESLVRPPRGFDPAHKYIEDIKRKDFVTMTKLSKASVTGGDFLETYLRHCRNARPLMKFLSEALA